MLLENRALLDVQFHESGVIMAGQTDRRKRTGKAGRCSDSVERFACGIYECGAGGRIQRSGEQAASRHPMPKRVGSSEVKTSNSMERRGSKPER